LKDSTAKNTGIAKRLHLIITALCLIFVVMSAIPVFGISKSEKSRLTYCPLQKKWVEPASSRPAPTPSLDLICATNRNKRVFVEEIDLNISAIMADIDGQTLESLFIDHAAIGDGAFAKLPSGDERSRNGMADVSKYESGTTIRRTEIAVSSLDLSVVQVLSRPPTFRGSDNFNQSPIFARDAYLHSAQPRAPPVSH